jgi:hypothetical protein
LQCWPDVERVPSERDGELTIKLAALSEITTALAVMIVMRIGCGFKGFGKKLLMYLSG